MPVGSRVAVLFSTALAFAGTVLDFAIVAFVVFLIVRSMLKPAPSAPVKPCPFCLETIPATATRCRGQAR